MPHLIGDPGGAVEPATVPFGDFYVEGDPRAQPRIAGRIVTPKGGKGKQFIQFYTKDTDDKIHAKWRKAVWAAAKFICPREPLEVPIVMSGNVYIQRPQRLMGKKWFDGPIPHPVQGDLDNFFKAIMDAMSKTDKHPGVWANDGQVFGGHWFKFYTAKDKGPGAYVLLETIDPDSQVNFPTQTQETLFEVS